MPEFYRKLQVTFSKAEIQVILAARARSLVLTRKDVKCVELEQVQHVEGEATVTLLIGNKPVAVPMRDKLIEARAELIDYVTKGPRPATVDGTAVKVFPHTPSELVSAIRKLTDYIEGRKPIGRNPKLFRLRNRKK
jgi:hypothetical protein